MDDELEVAIAEAEEALRRARSELDAVQKGEPRALTDKLRLLQAELIQAQSDLTEQEAKLSRLRREEAWLDERLAAERKTSK